MGYSWLIYSALPWFILTIFSSFLLFLCEEFLTSSPIFSRSPSNFMYFEAVVRHTELLCLPNELILLHAHHILL